MQKASKVVHVGLGPVGSRMVRHIVTKRKGIRYVGAIDVLAEIIGKDLAEIIGVGRKLGIKVSDEPKKVFEETQPDIAIYTTTPFLKDILPRLNRRSKVECLYQGKEDRGYKADGC